MKTGKVSVIIPVWKPNLEQLKRCLDSLIKQSFGNLEVILVYRKSQHYDDSFFSLVDEYNDDGRIRILDNKNPGFVNALNEGISNSTGEFVGRIDADDYCDPERFEKQLEFKKENKLDVVGSWAYWLSNDGRTLGKIEVPITHKEIRRKMMFHCPILHPTLLMDKEMLDKVGRYDPSFIHAEDYELYFRIMSRGYKFGNVPKYLSYIRDATQSRSRGSEWRKQRTFYIKAKNKAVFNYGFTKPIDIIYYTLTPIAYFMSPKLWSKIKVLTWNS